MVKLLRVVAVLHALCFLLQPVLAGLFLSGQDQAIEVHATNAAVLLALGLLLTILAFLAGWWRRLVPRGAFVAASGLFSAELVEMATGHVHVMWVHLPVGVLMMGGVVLVLRLVMTQRRQQLAAESAVTGVRR